VKNWLSSKAKRVLTALGGPTGVRSSSPPSDTDVFAKALVRGFATPAEGLSQHGL
jgi:hypothetical protein